MKLPLISRKRYEKFLGLLNFEINTLKDKLAHEKRLRLSEQKEHEEEIENKVNPMIDKFLKIRINYDPTQFEKYMVQVCFETSWIERCLSHGNSQDEIDILSTHIGRKISYDVERILITRNFCRMKS